MRKQRVYVAVAALAISLGACGTKAPRPTSELLLAGSALKSAEMAGAKEHAPIRLRLAREKKAAADKAIVEEKYTKARYLTIEARVDAELARAATDAKKSQRELERAQDSIGPLGGELLQTNDSQ